MSITIDNCSFTYPGTNVGVHDVNISAGQGELITVIGASGSGKTTMLKLVAGFEQCTQGKILINGNDVTTVMAKDRNVGVVFQSYALFPLMTCLENVAYPLKIRKVSTSERKKKAMDMLERVGLGAFAQRLPSSMSGGQQQRVALARALVFKPSALLLDEPLSALDANLRVELRNEIRLLQKEQGITALHVTHDQEEALSMADKVALMHNGKIVQIASPQEMYDAPNSRLVADFVGHANLWDGVVVGEGTVQVPFGELRCDTKKYKVNEEVVVLVRPEHIIIDPTEKVNLFSGLIQSDIFLGAVRRYEMQIGSSYIKGETSSRNAISNVSIDPNRICLLPNN